MPQFTFTCLMHDEDITKTIEADIRPTVVKCDECNGTMQRLIEKVNVVVKGASESNGFYVPPTNADLGMGSALDMEAEAVKPADAFLSEEDRDIKKDYDAQKAAVKKELEQRVNHISSKYGDYMNKFNKILKAKVAAKKAQKGIK